MVPQDTRFTQTPRPGAAHEGRAQHLEEAGTCQARERGGERQIDLVPDLEDPKDLFGLLAGEPAPVAPRTRVTA